MLVRCGVGPCPAAYRNAVREQKLATELRAAAKERDFYLQQVGAGSLLKAREYCMLKRKHCWFRASFLSPGEQVQGAESISKVKE